MKIAIAIIAFVAVGGLLWFWGLVLQAGALDRADREEAARVGREQRNRLRYLKSLEGK